MTIIIIQDEPGLKQYIHSHADAPQIMDLSDNRQVRTLYRSSLVNPPGFTGVQKKKILDEYIETISELGALNQFSLSWLCHPISEKNDLVSGSLLEQLVKFLQFYSVYSSEKEKPWIFYVEDPDLRRSILSVLNEEKKDVRIMQPVQQKNLSFLGRLRSIFATVKTCLQYQFRFMISFCFGMGVDKNKTYTVLRTWFDLRSPALLRQSEDIYFGKFPAFLQSEGHDVLFFGACIDGFGSVSKNLKRNSALPVVLQRSCLHGFDYLRAHVFQRSLLRRIRMKSGLTVLDIDVDVVFRNYLKTKKKSPQILANYLAYRAVLKLKKKIDVSYFFHPFENYGWEKVSRMAINKNGRRTRTVSFQHAQIALSSTKYFLGKNERHPSLLPDRIVTLGEVTRNFLVNEKKYPEELVRVGCALRSQISYPKKSIRRRPITKIMVPLWTLDTAVDMLEFIHACRDFLAECSVVIYPHPTFPEKTVADLRNSLNKDINEIEMASESFFAGLENADLVIYHGTTACLDALAQGLPVIDVEFDDFISPDPLFDFFDFKWTAGEPEELQDALYEINSLSDADYHSRQKTGFEFMRKYYYPVTESGMKNFLSL